MYYNYGIRHKTKKLYVAQTGNSYRWTELEEQAMKFTTFDEAYYIVSKLPHDMKREATTYMLPWQHYKVNDTGWRVAVDNIEQKLLIYNRFSGECKISVDFSHLVAILKNAGYGVDV